MCENCYDNMGRPFVDNDAVRRAASLIREADPFGPLHIVVDDWNLEDNHVQFCRSRAEEEFDSEAVALADALLQMTVAERASAMALADGFVYG